MTKSLVLAFLLFAPLSRGQNAEPLHFRGAVVTRTCVDNYGDLKAEPETEFLTTDPLLCVEFELSGGTSGDTLRAEVHDPSGALFDQWRYAARNYIWARSVAIAGQEPARHPGNWEIKFFANQQLLQSLHFRITTPPRTVVSLASSTALPQGTVKVAFRYQFSAKGGVPPYRWSLLKELPPGLALSSDGLLSGTPQRPGNYRLLIRADDSKGDSVQRTVGLGIGPSGEPWVHVLSQTLSKAPASPDACANPAPAAAFSSNDLESWLTFTVEPVKADHDAWVQWLDPRGDIYWYFRFTPKTGAKQCYQFVAPIAGRQAAGMPGSWRVRLIWQGGEVFSLPFELSSRRQGRHALVIGNGTYETLPPIPSVKAETDAVTSALAEDGFDVESQHDLSLKEWIKTEKDFADKLQPGDTAVIYFSGYGLQKDGANWLVPANYTLRDGPLYSAARLSQSLENRHLKLAIIVLDAAREQPSLNAPGQKVGLGRAAADPGTILVYSLPPGQTEPLSGASDPDPFAQAFVSVLKIPDAGIRQLLTTELPKAIKQLAADHPEPTSFMAAKEDFIFRAESPEIHNDPSQTRLYGLWLYGRAESSDPSRPPGPLCNFALSPDRGKYGNVISGSCSRDESFWRLAGDRLSLIRNDGSTRIVMSRVSDDLWQGEYILPPRMIFYLKRLPPETGALSSGLSSSGALFCADLYAPHSRDAPQKNLQLWNCHGVDNQLFSRTERGELAIFDRCVDADFGGAGSRELGIAACNGSASQKWIFRQDGHIVGNHGVCIAVKDSKAANGTALVAADCADESPAQTWRPWVKP